MLATLLRGRRGNSAADDGLGPPPSDGDIWFMVRVLRRCRAREPATRATRPWPRRRRRPQP